MQFYLPTRVYQEEDCVSLHAAELAKLGGRGLIVCGSASASQNGALQDVLSALLQYGVRCSFFSEVEQNPSVETILRGAELGRQEQVDFVIGIGGGSALDAAKAIALLLAHPGAGEEFLLKGPADGLYLPVAAIPTTCGTGSEVTGVSVLTRKSGHIGNIKGSIPHKLYPALALIDPRYLTSAPLSLIQNTAVDALCHLLESGLHSKATPYSLMAVREGLRVWGGCKPVLTGEKEPDSEDFSNLMTASTLAGMAIAQTGTSLPHALSYNITCRCGVPHGRACGMLLARYVNEAPKRLSKPLLKEAGFSTAKELGDWLEAVCPAPEVPELYLEESVYMLAGNDAKLAACPWKVTEHQLRRICGIA